MTARHARDGQLRDGLTALRLRAVAWLLRALTHLRHPVASLHLWLHWWDWPIAQAHYRRQYKRADRIAFAAECEEIRARATMHKLAMTPAAPASPSGQPDAALPPARHTAPSPGYPTGEGATPGRDTWVINWPPPGSPLGYTPVGRAPRHAATQPRLVTVPLWGELVEVTDGTGPRAVIWPQAGPSTRTTGSLAALDDLPAVPVRRCTTDVAAIGPKLIRGLRAI